MESRSSVRRQTAADTGDDPPGGVETPGGVATHHVVDGLDRIRADVAKIIADQMLGLARVVREETSHLSSQIAGLHMELLDSHPPSGRFRRTTRNTYTEDDVPPPPTEAAPLLPTMRRRGAPRRLCSNDADFAFSRRPSGSGSASDASGPSGTQDPCERDRPSYSFECPGSEEPPPTERTEGEGDRPTLDSALFPAPGGRRSAPSAPPSGQLRLPRGPRSRAPSTSGAWPLVERVQSGRSDRPTITSTLSGINSVGGLDELLTDNMFERFGLTTSRPAEQAAPLEAKLRALLRRHRPQGTTAPTPRLPARSRTGPTPRPVQVSAEDFDPVMRAFSDSAPFAASSAKVDTLHAEEGFTEQPPLGIALAPPELPGCGPEDAAGRCGADDGEASGQPMSDDGPDDNIDTASCDSPESIEEQSTAEPDALGVRLPEVALALGCIAPLSRGSLSLLHTFASLCGITFLLVTAVLRAQESDRSYFHFATCCMSAAALVSVLLLKGQRVQELIGPHQRPLETYAKAFGFFEAWYTNSKKRLATVLALWGCSAVSLAIMNLQLGCHQAGEASVASCLIFVAALAILFVVLYCILHVCCALELAIDRYCLHVFNVQVASNSIAQWNVMQALLRRAALCVEGGFVAAGTGVLCVMVLTLTEVFHIFGSDDPIDALSHHERICLGLWVGWVMPLAVLLFYTVFRAAAITEQCNRVPALVNSWVFEERELDREKQHVVQHIMHSFAGFYVKGIRLNASVAFKMSYLSGMLLFTFFTQRLLKST